MNEDLAKQLSSILKDKDIDLNQILDNFKATSSDENTNKENIENKSNSNQFDMNTILKLQKLLNLMNSSRFKSR